MKHVHYDKIVAKAANMDLVVLSQNQKDGSWLVQNDQGTTDFGDCINYFLCLPQHKDACLHWLNGGGVAVKDYPDDKTERVLLASGHSNWHEASVFMCERTGIRIKPKKEKRWIAVNPDGYVLPIHADSKESIRAHASSDTSRLTLGVQFIEIEVEV